MSRSPDQRLEDIEGAVAAIEQHLRRGDLHDSLVFDAVRVRLIEIGEAVKGLPPQVTAAEPDLPWRDIARLRDVLTHHYFDISHAVLEHTVRHDLPALSAAADRLLRSRSGQPRPGRQSGAEPSS